MDEGKLYTTHDKQYWMIILLLGLGSIVTFSNLYLVQPLLPEFVEFYKIKPTTASLSLSMSVLSLMVGLIFFGFLGDRIGRTRIMKITLLLSLIPLFLLAWTSSFSLIIILRFIQGFLMAGLPAAAIAYIGEECQRRSVAIGITIYIACNAIGGMAGRVFVGLLSDVMEWHQSIIILGFINLVISMIFIIFLPKSKHFKPIHIPFREDFYSMLNHVKNPRLVPVFMMGILLQISFTGLWTYLPFYLQKEPFHLSIGTISLTYLTYSFGVIGSPIAGRITERIRHATLMIWGVGFFIFGSIITLYHSFFVVIVGLSFICLGFFIVHSLSAAVVNQRALHHKGSASSLYLVSYYIGVAAGGFFVGFLWDRFGWSVIAFLPFILILSVTWIAISDTKRRHV